MGQIQLSDLEQSIENVSNYFGRSFHFKPKVKTNVRLSAVGECKFKRSPPLFQRHIVINPTEVEEAGGYGRVLGHELIHWLEFESGLNGYPERPSPHGSFPSHFLHIVYSRDIERQHLLRLASTPNKDGDMVLDESLRLEHEIKREAHRRLEGRAPWIIKHIERYSKTTGEPTPENLADLYGILKDAQQHYSDNPMRWVDIKDIVPYFRIISHYMRLLSVYTADKIGINGKKAAAFLEELKGHRNVMVKYINLPFWNRRYTAVVDFEKYNRLVQQFADA